MEKVKLNRDLHGYKAGDVIEVLKDSDSFEENGYWIRRIMDAKIDNCLEVLKPEKRTKNKTEAKAEKVADETPKVKNVIQ